MLDLLRTESPDRGYFHFVFHVDLVLFIVGRFFFSPLLFSPRLTRLLVGQRRQLVLAVVDYDVRGGVDVLVENGVVRQSSRGRRGWPRVSLDFFLLRQWLKTRRSARFVAPAVVRIAECGFDTIGHKIGNVVVWPAAVVFFAVVTRFNVEMIYRVGETTVAVLRVLVVAACGRISAHNTNPITDSNARALLVDAVKCVVVIIGGGGSGDGGRVVHIDVGVHSAEARVEKGARVRVGRRQLLLLMMMMMMFVMPRLTKRAAGLRIGGGRNCRRI